MHVSRAASALALALALLVSLAAPAQSDAPSHDRAKIRALIEQSGAGALADQLVDIVEQQILDGLRDAQGRIPDGAPAAVREAVGETLGEHQDRLIERMVDVYARAFSPAEVDELLAFYRSPAGGKLVSQIPTLMRASMGEGQAWVGEHRAELDARLRSKLGAAKIAIPE